MIVFGISAGIGAAGLKCEGTHERATGIADGGHFALL